MQPTTRGCKETTNAGAFAAPLVRLLTLAPGGDVLGSRFQQPFWTAAIDARELEELIKVATVFLRVAGDGVRSSQAPIACSSATPSVAPCKWSVPENADAGAGSSAAD